MIFRQFVDGEFAIIVFALGQPKIPAVNADGEVIELETHVSVEFGLVEYINVKQNHQYGGEPIPMALLDL